MASIEKFSASSASVHLRHIDREIENPSNPDIDPAQSGENYDLLDHGDLTHFKYYKERLSELNYLHRADVKTMAGWVVTAPATLPESDHARFFELVTDFLQDRYGEKNGVASVVHLDESGQPHLHYYFIPVVPDTKHGGEKICCKEVLTRSELLHFHPDLQKYLDDHGCHAAVHTGITKELGGNKTVRELKAARAIEMAQDRWHSETITREKEEEFVW